MFLTADQLHELTGYKRPAYQVKWLATNRVHFYVRADGRPVVTEEAIGPPEGHKSGRRPSEPNYAALDKWR